MQKYVNSTPKLLSKSRAIVQELDNRMRRTFAPVSFFWYNPIKGRCIFYAAIY